MWRDLQRLATVYYGAGTVVYYGTRYTTLHDKRSFKIVASNKQARVDPTKYASCFSHKHMITRTRYDAREANDPGAGAAASLYNSIVKQLPYVSK